MRACGRSPTPSPTTSAPPCPPSIRSSSPARACSTWPQGMRLGLLARAACCVHLQRGTTSEARAQRGHSTPRAERCRDFLEAPPLLPAARWRAGPKCGSGGSLAAPLNKEPQSTTCSRVFACKPASFGTCRTLTRLPYIDVPAVQGRQRAAVGVCAVRPSGVHDRTRRRAPGHQGVPEAAWG